MHNFLLDPFYWTQLWRFLRYDFGYKFRGLDLLKLGQTIQNCLPIP